MMILEEQSHIYRNIGMKKLKKTRYQWYFVSLNIYEIKKDIRYI